MQEDLAVKYHRQDTNYYCGAASAQMVLNTIGADIQDQHGLYADNHAHSVAEGNWYTAPDGLLWTLNQYRPPGFANNFKLAEMDDEDALSRKIVWFIHNYQVPGVASVYQGDHWLVVRGYEASAAPQSALDNSYSIDAFIVNNPWSPVLDHQSTAPPPPPPHTNADLCGTGGAYGVFGEHIAYSTWQSTYMTRIKWGSVWKGKYVAVCDPDLPAPTGGTPTPPITGNVGSQLLSQEIAADRAVSGLQQYELFKGAAWSEALAGSTPGEPVLVQRLDRPDSFYYNVPMQLGQDRAPIIVSVNAHSGAYRQSRLQLGEGQTLPRLDQKDLLDRVADRRFEFENRRGFLLLRKEALSVHPNLVWKPCRESQSPFYPFHMLTTATDRVYIRIDGELFTELHEAPGL